MGCILGQEQREVSPVTSRSAELGTRLMGQPLQVSTTEILQPKALPVTTGLENWLQPYRQGLEQGKEGCCKQTGVFTCVVMLTVKI